MGQPISPIQLHVKYRSRKSNANADALSRQQGQVEETLQNLTQSTSLHRATNEQTEVVHANLCSVTAADVPVSIVTLPGYSAEELARLQSEDTVISLFLRYWRQGLKPSVRLLKNKSRATRALLRKWDQVQEANGVLHIESQDPVEGASQHAFASHTTANDPGVPT